MRVRAYSFVCACARVLFSIVVLPVVVCVGCVYGRTNMTHSFFGFVLEPKVVDELK